MKEASSEARSAPSSEDGDEVVITATAPGPNGTRIGLGEVAGRVTAAVERPR